MITFNGTDEKWLAYVKKLEHALRHIDEITTGSLPLTYFIKEIIREALADSITDDHQPRVVERAGNKLEII